MLPRRSAKGWATGVMAMPRFKDSEVGVMPEDKL